MATEAGEGQCKAILAACERDDNSAPPSLLLAAKELRRRISTSGENLILHQFHIARREQVKKLKLNAENNLYRGWGVVCDVCVSKVLSCDSSLSTNTPLYKFETQHLRQVTHIGNGREIEAALILTSETATMDDAAVAAAETSRLAIAAQSMDAEFNAECVRRDATAFEPLPMLAHQVELLVASVAAFEFILENEPGTGRPSSSSSSSAYAAIINRGYASFT